MGDRSMQGGGAHNSSRRLGCASGQQALDQLRRVLLVQAVQLRPAPEHSYNARGFQNPTTTSYVFMCVFTHVYPCCGVGH